MAACWGLLAFIKAADERTYLHRHQKVKSARKTAEPAVQMQERQPG